METTLPNQHELIDPCLPGFRIIIARRPGESIEALMQRIGGRLIHNRCQCTDHQNGCGHECCDCRQNHG